MSLNDQYEELALYLAKAQNDISQVLEHQYATQLATHQLDEGDKRTANCKQVSLKNGSTPRSDHIGHKVHFADSYQEIYIEPNVIIREGRSSPYLKDRDILRNNEQSLKSCLKKTMKESQDHDNRSRCFDYSYGNLKSDSIFPRNSNHLYNTNSNVPKIALSGSYPCLATSESNMLFAPDISLNGNYLSPQNVIPSIRRWSPSPVYFQEETSAPYQDSSSVYRKDSSPTCVQTDNSVYCKENKPLCYEDLNRVFYRETNPYQETGIQCNALPLTELYHQEEAAIDVNNTNEADENLLALIASIKADIQELKQKYENDDEIERNRFLTKELDEILQMYKMNITMEKETDIISEIGSTSSYQSGSLANVVHNAVTQTSPPLSISSTNLSKGSECSSSPCLTSVSDIELADDESISSNEIKYQRPTIDWMVHSTPQAVLRNKSSSAPVLKNQQPKVNKQTRSQSDRHLAEIEAAEACKWLRATGFPQYAQMYEDMQFPVDISTAAQDHPRLEPDILNSLFRRLQILNNCVHLHQQRVAHNTDESEDENYALSKNWTFQSDIRRWSRACINEPNAQNDVAKTKKTSDETLEDHSGSPRERIRRGGSVKCRRRREGVIISENGAKLLDSLSEQLSGISVASSLNHASDSELTPKFYNRIWRKPAEDEFHHNVIPDNRIECQTISVKDEESNTIYCKFSSQQLGQLERIAMLKLTAYIEKYCPTHRTGWNWEVPKNLIRKMKNPAYKDKVVFGVPIQLTLQRTGHPLPRNIENALEWLQQNAVDQVGLFRKSGVKSRIQALRNTVEASADIISFEDQQSYDVADMVKQYFRELPEALLTNKLSETFKLIFQYVPVEHRLEAVLCGIFLMPDEHIEVLQTLVSFLIAIAKHSTENQMNESNLATCFAPSLFHYSSLSKSNLGTPQPKDLAENKAAHDCLLFFLENHQRIFTISRGLINQCNPAEMKEWKVLNLKELGKTMGGWKEYLNECEKAYLRELKEKSRGWTLLPTHNNSKVEIYFRKIDDGLSVRVWKAVADIDAPPSEVMHRILRERHIWDLELVSAKIVVQLDKNTEIFQYGRKRMAPLPVEEYCVVRHWKSDLPKGSCLIVETSVEHEDIIHLPDCIRGIVHASRYYIEPCGSGRSRLYHMCRTDTMGRKPEYYYKNYGHIIGFFISNIQTSFYHQTSGPESKV